MSIHEVLKLFDGLGQGRTDSILVIAHVPGPAVALLYTYNGHSAAYTASPGA